jgi:NADH:ubiquinone oxidoreductase subunit 2 (subunit N)
LEFYDFFFFITDILLFISLVIILIYNLYFKKLYQKNIIFTSLTTINIYIYLFFGLFIINLLSTVYVHYTLNFINSNYTFILRLFIIILFLIFFILLKYYNILSKNIKQFEFLFLIGCSALSLLLLLKSTNFISFIILLEIYSLISYILLVHRPFSLFSTEGGLKYFIIGSLSTGIAILGLFCIYTGTASYNYSQIGTLTSSYSPFWQPENPGPEFFETKARTNVFLFELCKHLNELAYNNYNNSLLILEH